jgi:hypothetical protein
MRRQPHCERSTPYRGEAVARDNELRLVTKNIKHFAMIAGLLLPSTGKDAFAALP